MRLGVVSFFIACLCCCGRLSAHTSTFTLAHICSLMNSGLLFLFCQIICAFWSIWVKIFRHSFQIKDQHQVKTFQFLASFAVNSPFINWSPPWLFVSIATPLFEGHELMLRTNDDALHHLWYCKKLNACRVNLMKNRVWNVGENFGVGFYIRSFQFYVKYKAIHLTNNSSDWDKISHELRQSNERQPYGANSNLSLKFSYIGKDIL